MTAPDARGAVLFEYKPPRAHPILYAGLLVFGFVFLTGSLENVLRDNVASLYWIYAAPLAAVALLMVVLRPGTIRIREDGVEPGRIALLAWRRPFIPWEAVAAAYPVSYDVTGAFVSPFASSDGKVTLYGLGLELADGTLETIKFTPTRFASATPRSRGYRESIQVVRDLLAKRGQVAVPSAEPFTEAEKAALETDARKPFLPFWAIVALFACAAPVLFILLRAGLDIRVALPISLIAPLGTSLHSYRQSRRRIRILNRLSRTAAYEGVL
ncbi:MAG: hypothetical protein AABX89_07745 [Candidatus Thermoplasmatota archaeon]